MSEKMKNSGSKRYYVEDENHCHHGPFYDYGEAADVADAVRGLIILQETEQSREEDTD